MGEAKYRRMNDPNFGRLPKDIGTRGLIVCPPIEIEGTRLLAKSSNLDPQELRFALLFWDKLVWPSSRAIYFGSGPDEQFLEAERILSRPDYTFDGDAAQGIAQGQVQAYLDLDRAEPGQWALAQGENSLLVKNGVALADHGALVELHRAVPIPKQEVPLAEILEFKRKRRDELLLMRHQIDSFVQEIGGSDDKPVALERRIRDIDEACADLLTVSRESKFPVYLANFKASFGLSPGKFLPAVLTGWKVGEPYGLTAASVAAAAAGAASTLEIKGDFALRGASRPASPYRYAFLAHEQLR